MKTNNAKVTRVEEVDGCMLTITLALPTGTTADDFSEAVNAVLNTLTEKTVGCINTHDIGQDIKPGYELTASGEVIEGVAGKVEITNLPNRVIASAMDCLNN